MKLDHVVYFTQKEPTQVVEEQQADGHHAIVGGRHEKWGTYNALLHTKNAYIEWLSVEKKEVAEQADHPLTKLLLYDLKKGDNWGTICLSVKGIEQFNQEVENKGFSTSGVLNAERKTNDGKLLKWKMLFVDQEVSNELPYPFFIEWEEEQVTRFAKLREDGILSVENEQLEIKECIFNVQDPLRDMAEWAILLSQKVGNANHITLSNVVLKFVAHNGEKDRLTEVVIGQTD